MTRIKTEDVVELAQDAETRAKYLEEYADIVSRGMYGGERPSGIWNLERAAKLLRQQTDTIERLREENARWKDMVHESLYHLRLDEAAKAFHERADAALTPSVDET